MFHNAAPQEMKFKRQDRKELASSKHIRLCILLLVGCLLMLLCLPTDIKRCSCYLPIMISILPVSSKPFIHGTMSCRLQITQTWQLWHFSLAKWTFLKGKAFIPLSLRQTWAEGKGLTAGMKNCLRLKASVGMVIGMRHNGLTYKINSLGTHPLNTILY